METLEQNQQVVEKFNRNDQEVLKNSFLMEKDEFVSFYLDKFPNQNKGLLSIAFKKNQEVLSSYSEEQLSDLLGTKLPDSSNEDSSTIVDGIELDGQSVKLLNQPDFIGEEREYPQEEVVKPKRKNVQRGHYASMETKYKKGQIVAFKISNEDRIVSGVVENSYFRKNSKPTGDPIYEQVSVTHNNVIYYKTSKVLDKYNGSN